MRAIFVILFVCFAAAHAEPSKTHTVKLNGHNFTLPVGFEIELVAGPPLVNRPMHADFDERGFLYVGDSSGSNEKVELQLAKKPHRIVRLEDSKGTGHFDKATTFADNMMLPHGAMWKDGSLYVAAPPSIWKLTDTKGTGVADKREEWFKGQTLTGCANDLHGPFAGPDGWIYWTKGAFAKQTYELDGKKFTTRASHIFRAKPDGTCMEPVIAGGMDNPVEITFTPGGEIIFTATFLEHPGGGKRDGLAHAVYGGVYGKDHAVIHEHPWTSPELMPVMTQLGAAAPAGLMRYESTAFGVEYKDNLFVAQFNMHKVSRHVLVPVGATFKTIDSDFLASDNFDFHPTDVLEDADGSLLVLDTGGWYKLCCPSSQMAKADVLGAIYRIRKIGAKKIEDPRGLKVKWEELKPLYLAGLLGDERLAVRKRAVSALAAKGETAFPGLMAVLRKGSQDAKTSAVWTANRINSSSVKFVLDSALKDDDETVRQAALHSIAIRRDVGSSDDVMAVLKSESLMNRRVAAEALGRTGSHHTYDLLLHLWDATNDRATKHSLVFAAIEIGDVQALKDYLNLRSEHDGSIDSPGFRGALMALDQVTGENLKSSQVIDLLSANNAAMRTTAWWIVGHHPEWGDAVAGVLRERLTAKPIADAAELEKHLATFSNAGSIQSLIVELTRPNATEGSRVTVLRAMSMARLKTIPPKWIDALIANLNRDDTVWPQTVETVRGIKFSPQQAKQITAALRTVGDDERASATRRRLALAAVPGGLRNASDSLFAFLRGGLAKGVEARDRSLTAAIFSVAKLNSAQLIELAASLKSVGPMEIDKLLDAFAQSSDPKVGDALLKALKASPIRSSLRTDRLKPIFAKCTTDAQALYALIDVDAEEQKAKLEAMLPKLRTGDVRRGQTVYQSAKVRCTACHAMGYQGGSIGPELTHIGKIRTERDLLESVMFPSASFVRSYEPVKVTTKAGAVHNGLIRGETASEITLQLDAERQVRIARDDIDAMVPGKVSIMPAGLDQQLSMQELADLIAFLKSRQ